MASQTTLERATKASTPKLGIEGKNTHGIR
jgi:hypothetical protein